MIGLWRWIMRRKPELSGDTARVRADAERRLEEAARRWPEVHAARRSVDALAAQVERAMRGAR